MQYLKVKGISPTEFYRISGTTRGILTQNNGINEDNLARFLAFAKDVNHTWLLTGEGEMLRQELPTAPILVKSDQKRHTSDHIPRVLDKYTPGAIPLVSAQAVGGFSGSDFSINDNDVLAYYVIPSFQNKGIDFMIRITGDSMAPRLWGGDIIACSIIHNPNFIQWNKTHLIATREQGLLVKRLRKSSDPDCILAVSNNPDYDPFDIPKQDILGIARVVGVIHLE